VEVIVTIAIIAILFGIAAPSLRSSINNARESVCLNTIRSVGQATIVYTTERDHWPHFAEQRVHHAFTNPLFPHPQDYWDQRDQWMLALADYFPGGKRLNPAAYDPWNPVIDYMQRDDLRALFQEEPAVPNTYHLSTALFSGWRLWSPSDPVADESQLTPVAAGSVRHPSRKAMYHEIIPHHLLEVGIEITGPFKNADLPVVLVDGSGRLVPWRKMPEPVDNPLGRPGGRLTNTENGYLGRDF